MFEKLVESILVEYVSEWVDGLDSEKMKIALFGGKVEFRELKLKASSLDKFQLPLKVKAGTIGTLTMKVPWKRLTKEAVKIQIDDLFLLVVPSHEEELHRQKKHSMKKQQHGSAAMEGDEEDSYALRLRWTKQQEVRVRELLEKNKAEENTHAMEKGNESSGGDTTASWGYREKILHNIMDNVSFELSKIHIRFYFGLQRKSFQWRVWLRNDAG
uniref:Chorein N-terminal domain-containing protein n=1 Tax=Globisporangium ultimum (strain ATCC 200006 / CBS 805.95 / DAOM BR144) TaxID=431595 RepID=K3W5D6_GLOUD